MFVVSCFLGGVKVGSYGFCDQEYVWRDLVPWAALCDPGAVNGAGSNGICDPLRIELERLYVLNGPPTLNASSKRPVLVAFGRGGGLCRGWYGSFADRGLLVCCSLRMSDSGVETRRERAFCFSSVPLRISERGIDLFACAFRFSSASLATAESGRDSFLIPPPMFCCL